MNSFIKSDSQPVKTFGKQEFQSNSSKVLKKYGPTEFIKEIQERNLDIKPKFLKSERNSFLLSNNSSINWSLLSSHVLLKNESEIIPDNEYSSNQRLDSKELMEINDSESGDERLNSFHDTPYMSRKTDRLMSKKRSTVFQGFLFKKQTSEMKASPLKISNKKIQLNINLDRKLSGDYKLFSDPITRDFLKTLQRTKDRATSCTCNECGRRTYFHLINHHINFGFQLKKSPTHVTITQPESSNNSRQLHLKKVKKDLKVKTGALQTDETSESEEQDNFPNQFSILKNNQELSPQFRRRSTLQVIQTQKTLTQKSTSQIKFQPKDYKKIIQKRDNQRLEPQFALKLLTRSKEQAVNAIYGNHPVILRQTRKRSKPKDNNEYMLYFAPPLLKFPSIKPLNTTMRNITPVLQRSSQSLHK